MNFFDSYYEVAKKMKAKAARQEFLAAIIDYYYSGGEEPEFKSEVAEVGFAGIRLSLDNSIKNSQNRREPNANQTKTKTERNANESQTKREPNVNQLPDEKEKEKEKERVTTNVVTTPIVPYAEIVTTLNEATGASFRSTSRKTQDCIKARFNEGYTLDDFKAVIEAKTADWLNDPDMCKYLRPETLFGPKFESYLNAPKRGGSNGEDVNDFDHVW